MSAEARIGPLPGEASERWQVDREHFNARVTSYITNPLVASAFRVVDRGLFVPEQFKYLAYQDVIVPLGDSSSISQPISVVAPMLDNLGLTGKGRVLEIGAGSGYVAALLSHCASEVVAVEYDQILTEEARDRLQAQDCINVSLFCGDGALGWPQGAPYDAIVVSAATTDVPRTLFDQLREGGRIVLPVHKRGEEDEQQNLVVGTRYTHTLAVAFLGDVRFYPLVSDAHGGWQSDLSTPRGFIITSEPFPKQTKRELLISTLRTFGMPDVDESYEIWADGFDKSVIWIESKQDKMERLMFELFGI